MSETTLGWFHLLYFKKNCCHHGHHIIEKSLVSYEKMIRYMALHVGDTAPPGTAWAFNKDIKWVYYTMYTYIRMVKR